jgi:hypothetical protein
MPSRMACVLFAFLSCVAMHREEKQMDTTTMRNGMRKSL